MTDHPGVCDAYAPEYYEGMVTSATLERWRTALRALTPKPAGEAIEVPDDEDPDAVPAEPSEPEEALMEVVRELRAAIRS